jgi:regulator of protease activity HflC (stomatin/prohibitin superfamily)
MRPTTVRTLRETTLLDKLVEFLMATAHSFMFWIVVEPYERGLILRLGKLQRELDPGFHWKLPFHIDSTYVEVVVPRTSSISSLATTTSDGKSIGFDAVITYRISDIRKSMLEVFDVADAITDSCAGIIGTLLTKSSWDDIKSGDVVDSLTAACRKRGFRFGVEIQSVQLKGISIVKNLRLAVSMGQHGPTTNITVQ